MVMMMGRCFTRRKLDAGNNSRLDPTRPRMVGFNVAGIGQVEPLRHTASLLVIIVAGACYVTTPQTIIVSSSSVFLPAASRHDDIQQQALATFPTRSHHHGRLSPALRMRIWSH